MIGYVALFMFVFGIAVGGSGMEVWDGYWQGRKDTAQKKAQDKMDAKVAEIEQTAKNNLDDAELAYQLYKDEQKKKQTAVYLQGQQYATTSAALNNPVCVLPADGMQLLNSARLGIRTAANTSGATGAVSGAVAAPAGRTGGGTDVQGSVPSVPSGLGAGSGVPGATQAVSGGGAVPGKSSTGHPKPVPVK